MTRGGRAAVPRRALGPDGIELAAALALLREAHGVSDATLIAVVERALATAWERTEGGPGGVRAELDAGSGRLRLRVPALVVADRPAGPGQITVEAARSLEPGAEAGAWVLRDADPPPDVVARAIQLAKAAVLTEVREADRARAVAEGRARRGELADGIVESIEDGVVHLRVGRLEAVLPVEEQLPGEVVTPGRHLKVVLLEVHPGRGAARATVVVSRAHHSLLLRLLEAEVPEVAAGLVVVRALVREPGQRAKVAVESRRAGIDPVGACVGPRGVRIRVVAAEIAPERVDVVAFDEDPAVFVRRALAPALVTAVDLEQAAHRARVLTLPGQLTLAIGRGGQNARLAARLTGWRIDIRAEAPG